MTKLAMGLLVLTLAAAIVQAAWWYPRLPAQVPTHFGPNGLPDGWSTPTQMIVVFVGLQFISAGSLALVAIALKFIPNSMINIPNRQYWLAPERREATLRNARDVLFLVAIATGWLLIGLFHLSAQFAVKNLTSIYPDFWWLIGAYLVVTCGVCGWIVYKYSWPGDVDAKL